MLIGEVARRSGVSARMLRHYDTLGLVSPTGRTVGGYREYAEADIRRIFHVEGLRSLGLSLRQIARALDDPTFVPSRLVGDLIEKTEDRLRQERELLDRLRAVEHSSPVGWQDVLRIVELLHGLNSPSAARRQQALLGPVEDAVPTEVLAQAVLTETDPLVAGALRWALARAGEDGLDRVADGVRRGEVDTRRRAVQAVAEISGDRAGGILTEALEDTDVTVRRYAALALGRRGVMAAVPTLVGMVVEGVNDVEAAEVLGHLSTTTPHTEKIMNALVKTLATADSVAARIRLTQALVEMPLDHALEVLRGLADDDDLAVARIASALTSALDAPPQR